MHSIVVSSPLILGDEYDHYSHFPEEEAEAREVKSHVQEYTLSKGQNAQSTACL